MADKKITSADLAKLKPFRMVKFFSYTSIGFIAFSTLALSWIISTYTTKVLLERSKQYTEVYAQNLSHQIFQQFVLPLALQNRQIAIQDPRQYAKLDSIVQAMRSSVSLQSVTIFSKKENLVSYSTDSGIIGSKDLAEEARYQEALAGKASSSLILFGSIWNLLPNSSDVSCLIKTYIPLRKEKPFSVDESVMGVIEVVQDLSEDLEAMVKLQATILGTSILVMTALFVVLSIIVHRGERIMAARAAERRKLEEKLHQSERLASLGTMVATVSHEIKNPLGIIHSTAEVLGKKIKKLAPGKEHLAGIIIDETRRLDKVVREFLDYARPQQPDLKEIAINDIVRRVSTFMHDELASQGIELNMTLGVKMRWLKGDFDQIYQAIMNIMVNGAQAMEQGGVLSVITRQEGETIFVEIADQGCGLSGEEVEQIFTPFYTSKNKGSGLGLAIVHNIMETHGAKITVESEEGVGSAFILAFKSM